MTTIQSPSHALGLMAINMYGDIAKVLPKCMNSPDGAGEVYPLILGLDALLYSYRETMSFSTREGSVKYWDKIEELQQKENTLTFGSTTDGKSWAKWFHEYLSLLCSCFQHLGLGPALENEEKTDDAEIEPADDNFIGDSPEIQQDTTTPEE